MMIMLQQLVLAAGIIASAVPDDERTCEDPIPNTHVLRKLNEQNGITDFGSVVRESLCTLPPHLSISVSRPLCLCICLSLTLPTPLTSPLLS